MVPKNDTVVYSAIYSGVPVYEIVVRDVPIMRRMADSYMNATQILKIAGFSKPKRTKILEQEILQGEHEKIQGGYGKYQGTWIPIETGRALAERYNVEHLIEPLVSFDPQVHQLGHKPLVKRQPRQPKEKAIDDDDDVSPVFDIPSRTTPIRSRQPSSASALSPIPFSNQQEPTPNYYAEVTPQDPETYVPSLVAKRLFDEETTQRDFFDSVYTKRSRTRTRTSESVETTPIEPITPPTDFSKLSRDQKNKELLLHLFVEQDSESNTYKFINLIRDESEPNTLLLNLTVDEEANSLLHWAASCGRIEVVRFLVSQGVRMNAPAKGGVTPLMKAIDSTRNYANQTMDELLTMLGPSLFTTDDCGRTALHYACSLSRYKSKRVMSSYYMDCIARYIEETRSATNSPTIAFVDITDENKDSALHIACRYRNHKCVMLLLRLGASQTLENKDGETARELCKHDYRLLKLLVEPETEMADVEDVPTTPISDLTESDTDMSVQETKPLERNVSSDTLTSLEAARYNDTITYKTARFFQSAKHDVQELRYYKDRFELIRKHSNMIKKSVQTSTETPITPSSIGKTQKQIMAETKLSSQLIRLDSLVKNSLGDQEELLAKMDVLARDRDIKDNRYHELLGMVTHTSASTIPELFSKMTE